MITKVVLKNYKKFGEVTFDVGQNIVLAGPNNTGKTTLLQAIATWNFGLQKWVEQRFTTKSRAKIRTGVPIVRKDFTPVPVRDMNLLWENRQVALGKPDPGKPRPIEITIHWKSQDTEWNIGLTFTYGNPEMVYVKPSQGKENEVIRILDQEKNLRIIHIPPFSGIEVDETRYDIGFQNRLVGLERPGEILRNLLLDIATKHESQWEILSDQIKEIFGVEIQKPQYSEGDPFIVCEYRPRSGGRSLDVASAGSGFLQVLMLLAFFYARPAAVLLLDEPDAHSHIILQRQVYDLLKKVASEKSSQLILATHSEVLLDATDPGQVISFVSAKPRILIDKTERDRVREAIRRLTTIDFLLAQEIGAILYLEGESDEAILREWARILEHPARRFLEKPYVHHLGGSHLKDAKDHFFALRAVDSQIRGLCILDGDNREKPDSEMARAGFRVIRWKRYEIENYLLQPNAIKRFVKFPLFEETIEREFWKQVPNGTDLFSDHVSLARLKASDEFFIPLLTSVNKPTFKKDLYLIAAQMDRGEIHPEIIEKLDAIYHMLLKNK